MVGNVIAWGLVVAVFLWFFIGIPLKIYALTLRNKLPVKKLPIVLSERQQLVYEAKVELHNGRACEVCGIPSR